MGNFACALKKSVAQCLYLGVVFVNVFTHISDCNAETHNAGHILGACALSALLCAERERRIAAGEEADIASVARSVGISVRDAASALFALTPPRSLDEHAYDDDDATTLGSTLCDEDEEIRSFDKFALRIAIEKLSEEHRRLIILRYFRDLSQTETAKILGLTQVKVSREEKKIMEILRRELN